MLSSDFLTFCLDFILQSITIIRPDDWHLHLRDGEVLKHSVLASAQHFARALVMPNLQPPLCSVADLCAYRERILTARPENNSFYPWMTFYLKETLSPDELYKSKEYPFIIGGKLYPRGVTTNSKEGIASLKALYPCFEVMQELAMVLQIHAESPEEDIFERESTFIRQEMPALLANFPKLRIVLEHVSTQAAVDFVKAGPPTLAATVTPQHLLYTHDQLYKEGLNPHYYCHPILKKKSDQKAIQSVVAAGHPKFFAGTDSAPHARHHKESPCCKAGIFSAPFALALYTEIFENLNALNHLNAFLSQYGADFYQVPYNKEELVLIKQSQHLPLQMPFGHDQVVPIAAGETIAWSVL